MVYKFNPSENFLVNNENNVINKDMHVHAIKRSKTHISVIVRRKNLEKDLSGQRGRKCNSLIESLRNIIKEKETKIQVRYILSKYFN